MKVLSIKNVEQKQIELPSQFSENVNADLIKEAHMVSKKYQPQGRDIMAGKRAVAKLSRRRRKYKGSYGLGISRVPRKILSRSGTRFNWAGAFAPGTVGGYRAHPKKSWTVLDKKMNKKEMAKALRSALSATMVSEIVTKRGHKIPSAYPFAVEAGFEEVAKTKEVLDALLALGFKDEVARAKVRKIRAGRGKMRGRKYKVKKGLLIIVSKDCNLKRAAKNIPGIDILSSNELNIIALAPGAIPGRVALFTESAITEISKKNIFAGPK